MNTVSLKSTKLSSLGTFGPTGGRKKAKVYGIDLDQV